MRSALRPSAVVAVILLSVAGCNLSGKPDQADLPVAPEQIANFDQLYATNCAGCHGATGKLGPAPPLNDPLFVAIIPEDELHRVIGEGRAGTLMPAFSGVNGGSLTNKQVTLLAEGIKSHWKPEAPLDYSPPAYAVTNEPQSIPALEGHTRRVAIYQRACIGCHGPDGTGSQRSRSGPGAINAPAFLALISNQALRRIIITGRPDLGMPTYAEKRGRAAEYQPLTSAEIDDLVALLAEWRSAGNTVAEQH
jgi:mono/diheme cytochrome c family protein